MAIPDPDQLPNTLLDEVYLALISSPQLSSILIYKGARILKELLVTTRYSQDIDVTLRAEFVLEHKTNEEQKIFLTESISGALNNHFENLNPVRYSLVNVDLRLRPGRNVPDAWRMFAAIIHVSDAQTGEAEQEAQIDISIGEQLSDLAVANISVGEYMIFAYTLNRIAGEKLRAFLSCLPAHRKKMGLQAISHRAKDLFDLAKIHTKHPITDTEFWHQAAKEFLLACEFRKIDCANIESFTQDWNVTVAEYHGDERLKAVSIEDARKVLETIVTFLTANRYIPFLHPIT